VHSLVHVLLSWSITLNVYAPPALKRHAIHNAWRSLCGTRRPSSWRLDVVPKRPDLPVLVARRNTPCKCEALLCQWRWPFGATLCMLALIAVRRLRRSRPLMWKEGVFEHTSPFDINHLACWLSELAVFDQTRTPTHLTTWPRLDELRPE
jgi:hypothetical protein